MAQRYPVLNNSNTRIGDRLRQRGPPPPPPQLLQQQQQQQTLRTKLFIENLPVAVDESGLRKRFQVFGNLEGISIIQNSDNTLVRLAICNYLYEDDAYAAFLGMNRKAFEGVLLRVLLAGATETYEDARSRSANDVSWKEDNIGTEYLDSIAAANEIQRNQICDHQDTNTGHICAEPFPNSQALMQHWWSHAWNYRPLKCEKEPTCVYTKRGFITENEREKHHNQAHAAILDSRPYKCPLPTCHYHKKGFETSNALSLHEKAHSLDFEEHICPVSGCTFETTRSEDVQAHMEDIHGILNTNLGPQRNLQESRRRQTPIQRRGTPDTRSKRSTPFRPDEKTDTSERFQSADDEKAGLVRRYASNVDYRPFKCQIRGCKFFREGFETQSELVTHEDKEHDGQRSMLTASISSESTTMTEDRTQQLRLYSPAPYSSSSSVPDAPRSPSPEFLQCNNTDCAESFALEQDWRKHAMICKSKSTSKQCSFSDCQAKFDGTHALSSHEFESHGIRICSSLTCNRAFHQLEDAETHMRDLHSNLYNEGRRPRLAFIASVPAWNEDIGETGFPYDPYRCALLNISQDKQAAARPSPLRHQASKKGKEVAREVLDSSLINTSHAATLVDSAGEMAPEARSFAGNRSSLNDTLPRYSVIMTQPSPFYSPGLSNVLSPMDTPTPIKSATPTPSVPATKPDTPFTIPEQSEDRMPEGGPSVVIKTPEPSHDGRNPQYRYNTDGSRYVTGAVVLSPDKHQVLVLRSTDESRKISYQLPSGFLEVNDQNMEASALRECWQNAGVVGRILRAIEPAPAEEPDENGLADWHSYFEIEVEREKERWPKRQVWHRRWLNYREARAVLSSQPDSIRALERSTIFKRGSASFGAGGPLEGTVPQTTMSVQPPKSAKHMEGMRPRRRHHPDERPPTTRKYNTVSPATDNIVAWRRDILPWLRRNFSTVMGKNKYGAIELLRVRNKPTICITCSDPKELELDMFAEVVSDLFPMHVKVGLLARSTNDVSASTPRSVNWMGEENKTKAKPSEPQGLGEVEGFSPGSYVTGVAVFDGQDTGDEDAVTSRPEKAFRSPPVFGKYHTRPSCGATIGTVRDDEGSISAGTFGGVVILVKNDGTEAPYGLISHHVIEEKTEDTELDAGVDEGWLINSTGAHRFPVQQPAKMDLEEAKDTLDMQRYYCDREKRYCDVDDGRAVRAKLALLDGLDQQAVDFGQVSYSSGYGFDANRHQMDWALVGDIPAWRLEDNIVPGVEHFYDLHYDGTPKAPYPVEKSFFNFLSETFEQEHTVDLSEIDPLRRIHGVGSYSGIMDGIVSSETAFFRLDGMDSEEWFFTPRYNGGLGVKGDSGTWIFDDFGKVVGQIIAYNYRTDTAYFTRMDYLFEHIKSKTKAAEVYIPYKGELNRWKTDEMPKQLESTRTGSVTDASSSYVDSAFGTVKTNDTDITSPLTISDSGLGWAGFHKQA